MGVLKSNKSPAGVEGAQKKKKTVRFAECFLEPLNCGNTRNENIIYTNRKERAYNPTSKYSSCPNFPQVTRTTRPKYVTKAKTPTMNSSSPVKERRLKESYNAHAHDTNIKHTRKSDLNL